MHPSRHRPCRHNGTGFTLIELLVVIAVICVLIALIWPSLGNGLFNARSAACVSNLRQISMAAWRWAGDNDNRFPNLDPVNKTGWSVQYKQITILGPYVGNDQRVF